MDMMTTYHKFHIIFGRFMDSIPKNRLTFSAFTGIIDLYNTTIKESRKTNEMA